MRGRRGKPGEGRSFGEVPVRRSTQPATRAPVLAGGRPATPARGHGSGSEAPPFPSARGVYAAPQKPLFRYGHQRRARSRGDLVWHARLGENCW